MFSSLIFSEFLYEEVTSELSIWVFLIISILISVVPVLLSVALLTLVERKIMAALQRRRGPNIVGFFGLLQPFADGLKLLTKEFNIPSRSFDFLVVTTPILSLMFTCSCFAFIPFGYSSLFYGNVSVSALYVMAISSLNIYSIIMAGWASKSAYAFLGSLRASAQFISYEVSLTLNIMGVFLISGSFSLSEIAYMQEQILPNVFVIFPIFVLFFIGVLSETNRTPYDLAEAESELVAGYGVEFSAVGFAFFFIAEYASIILYCLLTIVLFGGGILVMFESFFFFVKFWCVSFCFCLLSLIFPLTGGIVNGMFFPQILNVVFSTPSLVFGALKNVFSCVFFGVEVCFLLFIFCYIRATYARFRFDQLMKLNWKNLLLISLIFDIFVAIVLVLGS